jgi:hypothetical protein
MDNTTPKTVTRSSDSPLETLYYGVLHETGSYAAAAQAVIELASQEDQEETESNETNPA